MARWQPGALDRLQAAALERFTEQGYDATTVAGIAATAGLTERTFYRYFADKREVLFGRQDEFVQAVVDGLGPSAVDDPAGAVVVAFGDAAAAQFPDSMRAWTRARRVVVDAEPSLRERELLKMSALADALTGALTGRGVGPTAAALAAQTGIAVFRVAVAAWSAEGEQRSLAELQQAVFNELGALVGRA